MSEREDNRMLGAWRRQGFIQPASCVNQVESRFRLAVTYKER